MGLALAALWFVCCRYLSAEWAFNEQYNYGWFVPVFTAYLFWQRWIDRPEPVPATRKFLSAFLICGASLFLLPLRVFEIGSADWRPLGWMHVTAATTISLSIVYLAGGKTWLRHFSFPVLFFFVAVPWITPIETPIVQGFMRIIAASAAETLALLGIPVEVQGNLLRLPNGVVGINEACSGVRSFQTSLMIGLLFGEVKRLGLSARVGLIAAAIGIAIAANFLRASFLVWIASRHGLAAVGQWHDFAGYFIVVVVFGGTLVLATFFDHQKIVRPGPPAMADSSRSPQRHLAFLPRPATFAALLVWLLGVELAAEFWYRAHEQDLIVQPSWSISWPADGRGYHEIKIDPEVRNQLRFNSGRAVAWTFTPDGVGAASILNNLFFFRWNPGSGTILRARAHRPDICLPAAGWKRVGSDQVKMYWAGTNLSLPFRRFDFVKENSTGLSLHAVAFFTLHEDASHAHEGGNSDGAGLYSNWDWADRWRVVRNGIRNRGQQVLELIMVEPSGDDAAIEQRFAALLPKLVQPSVQSK